MKKKHSRLTKIKIIKKRKKQKKEKRRKKKKENSTELQKPNVKAEVYNHNRKCD